MAKKNLKKGIFITFEGPEGCGKSTHSRLARDFLKNEGYDVTYTREPGGTKLGDKIRNILLDSKDVNIPPIVETLLFEVSRAELVDKIIKPALTKKRIVISDRFNDATLVYQGYAGGVPIECIKKAEKVSIEGLKPNLTILLDIDPKEGLRKIKHHKKDRMESKHLKFHNRVRRGYLKLAKLEKDRIKVIKTKDKIEDTFEEVKKEVINAIRRYKGPGKRH